MYALLIFLAINGEVFGEHLVEKQGGFEIYGPKTWEITDVGLKYKVLMGPTENQFTLNINFSDEAYNGPIADYIDATIDLLPQFFSNFTVVERDDFTTNDGLTGVKMVTQANLNQIAVRQRMYFFLNGKDKIMIITASSSQINGENYDDIFDKSVKTFKWVK
jgi:hypothetical protein